MVKDFIGKYPNFSDDLLKHKKYSMSAGIYVLIEKHLIEKIAVIKAIRELKDKVNKSNLYDESDRLNYHNALNDLLKKLYGSDEK